MHFNENELNNYLTIVTKEHKVNAITIGIKQNEESKIYASGLSMTGVKNTSSNHYRLGGQSIPIFTTILLNLVDERKIRLDDTIDQWYSSIPNSHKITLRMLANSTSGLPDYARDNVDFLPKYYQNPFYVYDKLNLLDLLIDSKPLFEPGTSWHYTPHTNMLLLGLIMEKVTHTTMNDLLREYITAPLNISNTMYNDLTAEMQEPVLHSYTRIRGVFEESTYWHPSWGGYSTGITSTTDDLLIIYNAIASGSLITDESFNEFIRPMTIGLKDNNNNKYYGFGLMIEGNMMWINQLFGGYCGYIMIIKNDNDIYVTIVETNTINDATTVNAQKIYEDFYRFAYYAVM